MAKLFNKGTILTTVLLLAAILAGEVLCHTTGLPTWPLFTCMVSYFLAEQKKDEIKNIVVGALVGEAMMWLLVQLWLPAVAETVGVFPAQMIFVLTFVGSIVIFGPVAHMFLNSFAFLFFLVAALGKPFEPLTWMLISGIGGPIICYVCIGINKIVAAACVQK